MATAEEVARWMYDEVRRLRELPQIDAAEEIQSRFGEEHVYENENGNPAIGRAVLAAFRRLSAAGVVWDRGERTWRMREPGDGPGRQTDW